MAALIAGVFGVAELGTGIARTESKRVGLALIALIFAALPRAGRGELGALAASIEGITLFAIAHFGYRACERSDVPASYAGGRLPRHPIVAPLVVIAGTAFADAAIFSLLAATRGSLREPGLLAVLGIACTVAIAGVVAALALRTPPVR